MLLPLVVVVGTTGVGKSKLAVELAQALPSSSQTGCVLNADAMQVYRGLDVITNKIPLEEQKGIQHSLMGLKEPGEQYVVGEWIRDALRVVSSAKYLPPGIVTKGIRSRTATNEMCFRSLQEALFIGSNI
jgi:tRNA A37 N6-isopentenylltransferase MiaA